MALLFGQGFTADELALLGIDDVVSALNCSTRAAHSEPLQGVSGTEHSATCPSEPTLPSAPAKPLSWAERMRASAQAKAAAATVPPANMTPSTAASAQNPVPAGVVAGGSSSTLDSQAPKGSAPETTTPNGTQPSAEENETGDSSKVTEPTKAEAAESNGSVPIPTPSSNGGQRLAAGASLASVSGEAMEALQWLTAVGGSGGEGVAGNFGPRGLVNTGNTCFMNSTLQALFCCPPFVQLVHKLVAALPALVGSESPTLCAIARLAIELGFAQAEQQQVGEAGALRMRHLAFNPVCMEPIMRAFCPAMLPGRGPSSRPGLEEPDQHDAQEFLTFMLDAAHQELLTLQRLHGAEMLGRSPGGQGGEEEEWEQVGKGNRSAVTRGQVSAQGGTSHVSAIFGGALRSEVRTPRSRPSATKQHFTVLHLDIYPNSVDSVDAALVLHTSPETISGYRAEGSAIETDATKRVQLLELPQVLVLHLMRFTYGAAGTGKLHKPVSFGPTLRLKASMLADGCTNVRGGNAAYDLIGVVQHHGRTPAGGHYTADVRCGGPGGEWMHFNDDRVATVDEAEVLQGNAYLLFYSRVAN